MKNLEKFGIQELDAVSVQNVNGGFDIVSLIGAVVAVVYILDEAYDAGYYLGSQMP